MAEKSNRKVTERVGRTKKVVMKVPSGRTTRKTSPSSNSSSSSEEEATPIIHKRKRSSPKKKTSTTSGANFEKLVTSKATSSTPENVVQSIPTPSPDTDDHLTLKRLKVLHSQVSNSHTQASVQTSKPIQPTINTQPTMPSTILTLSPEVVDIKDSVEEQGLQANIFNKISSPPI